MCVCLIFLSEGRQRAAEGTVEDRGREPDHRAAEAGGPRLLRVRRLQRDRHGGQVHAARRPKHPAALAVQRHGEHVRVRRHRLVAAGLLWRRRGVPQVHHLVRERGHL